MGHDANGKAMLQIAAEVQDALSSGSPLVALESSVLAQGLPIPANEAAARAMDRAVRAAGATPAITAVIRGIPTLGLLPDQQQRLLAREGVRKVAARDLPLCIAQGADGATTVSAALAIAALGGVRVLATGGIGGVHRGIPFDESADLGALARTPIIVVCAGAKSILDLPATLERLESHGVSVVGYRTNELPGFFTAITGLSLSARVDSEREIIAAYTAARALRLPGAMLVVQPPPRGAALEAAAVDFAVGEAVQQAEREGVTGAAVTPFLLEEMNRQTGGGFIGANLALLENNAGLAGRIAVELFRAGRH